MNNDGFVFVDCGRNILLTQVINLVSQY